VGTAVSNFGHGIATGDAKSWGTAGELTSLCTLMPTTCVRGAATVGRGVENAAFKADVIITEQANKLGIAGRALDKVPTGWSGTGGSGPVSGTIGITDQTSVAALRNYYPKGGGVEFIYDPATRTFVAGRPASGLFTGSPHQQLAQSIGTTGRPIVGGTLQRGKGGTFITTENSGHFGRNWTDATREQFQFWLSNRTGMPVKHTAW
jgi:hypothetical protein